MDVEQLLQIRRRIIYLNYSKHDDRVSYEVLKNEQQRVQSLLKDSPDLLRMEGIKSSAFGDFIMRGNDLSHKELFFKATKNEIIAAIDSIIYK